MWTNPQIKNH